LKRFGVMHFDLDTPPTSNLIRKMYHCVLHKLMRQGKALQLMQKVDAHSAKVAHEVYTISTAEDDASLAAQLFKEVFGDPVEFPSEAVIKNMPCCLGNLTKEGEKLDGVLPITDNDEADVELDELEQFAILAHENTGGGGDILSWLIGLRPFENAPLPLPPPESPAIVVDDASTPKKARYFLIQGEKNFLDEKAPKGSANNVMVPWRADFMKILEEGKRLGTLSGHVTYDAAETYLRQAASKLTGAGKIAG